MGVQPVLGRSFTEAEDHPASDVVMLTWSVFQRRFAGDASIVGRQIHLDGKPYTVVGVLPASFTYPDAKVQVWVPYAAPTSPEWLKHHDNHQSRVIARLRPGVSLATAISQVEAVQYREHIENLHLSVAEDVESAQHQGRRGARCEEAAHHLDERGGLHALDRLPECSQPAGGARRGPAEGSCCAHRPGGAAAYADSRADDGKRVDLLCGGGTAGVVLLLLGTEWPGPA